MNIRAELLKYITERFVVVFEDDLDANSDLFQRGILDSHGYIEVIRFIEQHFGVQFTQREILLSISPSLEGLSSVVEEKLKMQQPLGGSPSLTPSR